MTERSNRGAMETGCAGRDESGNANLAVASSHVGCRRRTERDAPDGRRVRRWIIG